MKPRYQIGPHMLFPGKTVLVRGAGGLWGSHMAAGMAAAQADLILVDTKDRKGAVDELQKTIMEMTRGSADIRVTYVPSDLIDDRAGLLSHIADLYGQADAVLDVRAINPAP